MCGLVFIFFYYGSLTRETNSRREKIKLPTKKMGASSLRQMSLGKATSEIITDPTTAINTLKSLVQENPEDQYGKEALQALVSYYRTNQKPVEEAQIYLLAKRPGEAGKIFFNNPATKQQAEESFFAAYELAKDVKEKKEYLLKDIGVLVGPLNQYEKGVERIRLFESKFPGEQHPYKYYVRSIDERIADIFPRLSFYFVQTLLAYIDTEMPQITLLERPLIEVKKNKLNEYRLTGTYKGSVLLNKDTMKNIYFVFWSVGERWLLVDTNMTKERSQWAQGEKEKQKNNSFSASTMLRFLETLFKTQFPMNALHEPVNSATITNLKKKDDGF